MESKELVWLPKELALKVKEYENILPNNKKTEEIVLSYLKNSESEIRSNLEQLDENVLMYKGLMIKAKQEFKKAADEQISQSYELWENFDKQRPQIHEKIESLNEILNPLKKELNAINEMLRNIQTWSLKDLLEILDKISNHLNSNKETGKILKFLVNNYNGK